MSVTAKPKRRPAKNPAEAPKPYHHGDLRRALIGAALQLVEEGGAEGLSVREAARRAGGGLGAALRAGFLFAVFAIHGLLNEA